MRLAGVIAVGLALAGCQKQADTAAVPASLPGQDRDPYLAMNTMLVGHQCSNCHATDYPRVGPGMRDVASAYATATAEDRKHLVDVILNGTKGKWGAAVMPPQHQVTPADADTLVTTILALNAIPAPKQ